MKLKNGHKFIILGIVKDICTKEEQIKINEIKQIINIHEYSYFEISSLDKTDEISKIRESLTFAFPSHHKKNNG